MYSRYLQLNKETESSIFLFGARQTGKSTILRKEFPKSVFIKMRQKEEEEKKRMSPFAGIIQIKFNRIISERQLR